MYLSPLMRVYPELVNHSQNRLEIGLTGDEPWPVSLPGHLFHALTRPMSEVRQQPYLPRSAEEAWFPSQTTDPLTAAEHAEAQRKAYFYARQRGGEKLPPYDRALADKDFQRAAAEVVSERPGATTLPVGSR
jgi:hypothetical protein